jgi:hypothetical protein
MTPRVRVASFLLVLFSFATAAQCAGPGRALASTVGDDMKALVSPRTGTVLLAGGMLAFVLKDVEDPDAQEKALGHGLIDGPADFGNTYGNGLTLSASALALYGGGRLAHDPGLRDAGSEMARSLLYTGAIVTAAKLAVHRTRPDGGPWSFPSGHTAAAFAVAPVLAKHFGSAALAPAYALAVGTALGRLEDKKHFLSDVTVGAAIGLSVGLAVTHTHLGPAELGLAPQGAEVSVRF